MTPFILLSETHSDTGFSRTHWLYLTVAPTIAVALYKFSKFNHVGKRSHGSFDAPALVLYSIFLLLYCCCRAAFSCKFYLHPLGLQLHVTICMVVQGDDMAWMAWIATQLWPVDKMNPVYFIFLELNKRELVRFWGPHEYNGRLSHKRPNAVMGEHQKPTMGPGRNIILYLSYCFRSPCERARHGKTIKLTEPRTDIKWMRMCRRNGSAFGSYTFSREETFYGENGSPTSRPKLHARYIEFLAGTQRSQITFTITK